MTKQLRGVKFDKALDSLLRRWQNEPPDRRPINVKVVAEALSVSRTSLYKEAHDATSYPAHLRSRSARIEAAARRQEENVGLSPRAMVDKVWHERLRRVENERDEWRARYEQLLLRVAGMEHHAHCNGWDASELWKPLPPNNRAERGRAVAKEYRGGRRKPDA